MAAPQPRAVRGGRRQDLLMVGGLLLLWVAPRWMDYVTAMRDLRIGADYSFGSLPLLAVPLVAWVAMAPRPRRRAIAVVHS